MIIQVGKVFPYHCLGFLYILLFHGIVLLDMNKEDISVLIRQECLCYNEIN